MFVNRAEEEIAIDRELSIRDLRIDADAVFFFAVKAVFVELPAFERHRAEYLDEDSYRDLQLLLMSTPDAGDVIPGTGGLRKMRFADVRRARGNGADSE